MEYNVEYNVLQEEITTTNHHLEMLNQEKSKNSHLEQQLQVRFTFLHYCFLPLLQYFLLQFAQSSIAQLERTRSSQQSQITTLQSQVQSLELTIQTLGRYVAHLAERHIDLEIPQEIRRVLQQLDDLERQRRKPIFAERKIGKSVSVNSHLGFPLKVLEELNEKEEHGSPQKTKKTPFFENTYEQLRQQRNQRNQEPVSSGEDSNSPIRQLKPKIQKQQQQQHRQQQQRPNRLYDEKDMQTRLDELKLPEHVDRFMANIKSPLEVDSGVGTPLSPPSTSSNSSQSSSLSSGSLFSRIGYKNTPAVFTSPLANRQTFNTTPTILSPSPLKPLSPELELKQNKKEDLTMAMHPLSMVGEVDVKFNGITQLKSIKPTHYLKSFSSPSSTVIHQTLTETEVENETKKSALEEQQIKATETVNDIAKATTELAQTAAAGNS